MRLLAYKKVSLTAQKTEPYTAWKALYAKLKSTPQKTQAALSLQWLWLLQKGSSVAPAVYEDQQKLSLDQSPFVTGGGYLRTEANAYLTKQLKQINTRLSAKRKLIQTIK